MELGKNNDDYGIEINPDLKFKTMEIEVNYGGFIIQHSALKMIKNNQDGIMLHYFNTFIRRYADKQYDHMEILLPDETKDAITITSSLKPVIDYLLKANYPHSFEPIPNASVLNWYLSCQNAVGSIMIEDFLKNNDD